MQLFHPAPGGAGRRPRRFWLNAASPHAVGLTSWWCVTRAGLLAVRTKNATQNPQPVTLQGSPTSALYAPANDEGLGARTEQNGAVTQRAWNTGLPGALDSLGAFTIAYWLLPLSNINNNTSYWGQGVSNSCFLESNGTTTGPFLRGVTGGDLRGAFTEFNTASGMLQHNAWTYLGSVGVSQYYNGLLKKSVSTGGGVITAADTNGLYLGGQASGSGGATESFDGLILDWRVYSRTLSAPEIWSLYDPSTRWNLYAVPSPQLGWSVATGTARLSRLTLLGVG